MSSSPAQLVQFLVLEVLLHLVWIAAHLEGLSVDAVEVRLRDVFAEHLPEGGPRV